MNGSLHSDREKKEEEEKSEKKEIIKISWENV